MNPAGPDGRLPQLVWGKLVARPGGPVVSTPGLREYRVTGRSERFPPELVPLCHADGLGMGADPRFDWSTWPWRQTPGGIATCVADVGGRPTVLAGRVAALHEGGDAAAGGRAFQQAQYVAIPAARWAPWAPIALERALHPTPMATIDLALPELEWPLAAEDHPLAEGWWERARPFVRVLVSGHALTLQDWKMPLREGAQRMAEVLACLPLTLAWRIGLGLGVVRLPDHGGLGLVMKASTPTRIVGGTLRGADTVALDAGDRWVERLEPHLHGVTTLAALSAQVGALAPRLATWDAVEPGATWAAAAARVAQEVEDWGRVSALRAYLAAPSGDMPPLPTGDARTAAVELLLSAPEAVERHTWEATTAHAWRAAWAHLARRGDDTVGRRARGVGVLMGVVERANLRDMLSVRRIDVPVGAGPAAWWERVDGIGPEAAEVEQLLEAQPGDAPWLGRWRAAVAHAQGWCAVRDLLALGRRQRLDALRDTPAGEVVAALLDPELTAPTDALDRFVAAAPSDAPRLIDRLVLERGMTPALVGVITRLERTGRRLGCLADDAAAQVRARPLAWWRPLARWLPRHGWEPPRTWFAELLRLRLDGELGGLGPDGAALDAWLATRVGHPAAGALLGVSPAGSATPPHHAAVGHAELVARACADEEVLWRVLDSRRPVDRATATRLVGEWASSPHARPMSPAGRLLRALLQPRAPWPGDVDLACWRKVATTCGQSALHEALAALASASASVAELTCVVGVLPPDSPPPALSVDVLAELLQVTQREPSVGERWRLVLPERQWHRAPGWRLVSGEPVERVTDNEHRALGRIPMGERLTLLGRGLLAFEAHHLRGVTAGDVTSWNPTLAEFEHAVTLAVDRDLAPLRVALLAYGEARLEIEAPRRRRYWTKPLLGLLGGKRRGWTELVELLAPSQG